MAQRRSLNPFNRNQRVALRTRRDRLAAHQITPPMASSKLAQQQHTQVEDWQEKILRYSKLVPEVMTGYSFVHNVVDRVTFEIQRFDRLANEWVSDDTPAIQGLERRINHSYRAGRTAALLHLIEEAFLLVTRREGGFEFETLSPTEIRFKNGQRQKRVLVDGTKEDWVLIEPETTSIRIYTPSPANRDLAGGPHESLTGLLETMALEILREQSESISVLAGNGILLIPSGIVPDDSSDIGVSDTPGTRTHFENELEDSMLLPISDPKSAAAIVPITLTGPFEELKEVRHLTLNRRDSSNESGERTDRHIKRYARDIDLPSQIILGIGDANHWADWKVDENTWAYHLEPRAQRIADAIYDGLIIGIIENIGLDPSDYRLVPDSSQAVAQQDRGGAAAEAYTTGVLKPESYIEAIGFDPSDMRVDAEESLMDIISQPSQSEARAANGQPDRVAAARPATILRGASRIANQQQKQLDALYRRILEKVAADAARAGRKARKTSDKTAASDPVTFLGYEPGVYFNKYRADIENGTIEQLFTLLRRIATLTGLSYASLRSIWRTEFVARSQAVSIAAEQAALSVERASFKTGKPARVTEATIRTMTSLANGGVTQQAGAVANTQRPTHAAADPALRTPVEESAGGFVTQYTWIHDEPARPFPPHEELNGRTWYTWEEGDRLDHSGESFPPGTVYFPGDHDGCLCEYGIEFVSISEAEQGLSVEGE